MVVFIERLNFWQRSHSVLDPASVSAGISPSRIFYHGVYTGEDLLLPRRGFLERLVRIRVSKLLLLVPPRIVRLLLGAAAIFPITGCKYRELARKLSLTAKMRRRIVPIKRQLIERQGRRSAIARWICQSNLRGGSYRDYR